MILVADLVGQVLVKRSAEGDVEHLDAAADAQHGHVALHRAAGERDLERVAQRVDVVGGLVGLGAIGGGIHVVAARQDEAVDSVQQLVRLVDQLAFGRDQQGQSAGPLDPGDIAGGQQRRRLVPDAERRFDHRGDDGNRGP